MKNLQQIFKSQERAKESRVNSMKNVDDPLIKLTGKPLIITLEVYPQGVQCRVSQPLNSLVLADILMTTASNSIKAMLNQNSMLVGKKDGPQLITKDVPESNGDAS